ncbi:MAG: hypothetical protein HRT88_09255 [Lentisphaeraceae bacterium]|nr:hypothetical protein [Lentisphaeraceae bacterium]
MDNQSGKNDAVEDYFNLACTAMTLVWINVMKQGSAPTGKFKVPVIIHVADIRAPIEK